MPSFGEEGGRHHDGGVLGPWPGDQRRLVRCHGSEVNKAPLRFMEKFVALLDFVLENLLRTGPGMQ